MPGLANSVLRGLTWSARRGSILLAVGIFGGIVSPGLARLSHSVVTPDVLVMTMLVLLRMDIAGTLMHLRRPGRLLWIVVTQMIVCPLVVWALVAALPLDDGIKAGLVIFATGCAATSSAAFARLVGLDADISLLTTLTTLVLVPITAPPVALWLLGIDLSIGTGGFMLRLLVVVGLPMLVSLGLRRLIGPDALRKWGDAVDGALVWLVVLYGFAVMDGLSARARGEPGWVVQALIAAFAVDYGLNIATTLGLARLGTRVAASAGLMSGNRNMSLYLAVLPASTDPRIILFFGLCQIPLFLSPFLLRPVYRRWMVSPARPADGRSHASGLDG